MRRQRIFSGRRWDCPGFFAGFFKRQSAPALLGRFAARLLVPVEDRRKTLIVSGWAIGHEGRPSTMLVLRCIAQDGTPWHLPKPLDHLKQG